MPFKISCGDCSAKLTVKDELAGRAVKCPKCAKIIKIPAAPPSDEESPAPVKSASKSAAWDEKPASKRAAPEPAKPAKKPAKSRDDEDEEDEPRGKPAKRAQSRDDDDDDEAPRGKPAKRAAQSRDDDDEDDDGELEEKSLKQWLAGTVLPDSVKKMVTNEITGKEDVVWVGQPCPKMIIVRNIWAIFVGLFFISMMVGVGGSALLGSWQGGAMKVVVLGVLWLILAAAISIMIPLLSKRKAHQTCYVVTTRRAIAFTGGYFGSPSVETFKPNLLAHMRPMKSWIFKGGAGDLVFRSVTTITTTYKKHGGTSTSRSTTYYGFLAIRNMEDVERIIRRTLLVDDDDDDDD